MSDQARCSGCEAESQGQRCIRAFGHEGAHIAPSGPVFWWDERGPQNLMNSSLAALVWASWAKKMGTDPIDLQISLFNVCREVGVHPSTVLYGLLF